MGEIKIINLSDATGYQESWGKSKFHVFCWAAVELVFVSNPWQFSSRLRVFILRLFGAQIGAGVIFRPRTRVKFPWKLEIGGNSWIGEGVWMHNQDFLRIGNNVVISQETMITTGSHAYGTDMSLLTKEVIIEDGVWVTSKCLILGGTTIRKSAMIAPMSVVSGSIPAGEIWQGNPATYLRKRF